MVNKPKPKPKNPVGRPARGGITTTRRVLVAVSPREYALLTLACPMGSTVSAWARDVLLEFMATRRTRKTKTDGRRAKRRGA